MVIMDAGVGEEYWCMASDVLTDIENMLFNSHTLSSAYFDLFKLKPDVRILRQPLCKMWYYVYPDERSGVFADRRACGR